MTETGQRRRLNRAVTKRRIAHAIRDALNGGQLGTDFDHTVSTFAGLEEAAEGRLSIYVSGPEIGDNLFSVKVTAHGRMEHDDD
jgi:hypothetical protein